jgi:hypothetical protein
LTEFDDVMDFERKLEDPDATDPRVQTARRLEALATSLPAVNPALLDRARASAAAPVGPSWRSRVLVAAVVIALAAGVVGNAARTALPGDALWDVRRVGQVVRYQLTFSPDGKADLLLSQAEGALQAARELAEAGASERAVEALSIAAERIVSARTVGATVSEANRARVAERLEKAEKEHGAIDDPDDHDRGNGNDNESDADKDRGRGNDDRTDGDDKDKGRGNDGDRGTSDRDDDDDDSDPPGRSDTRGPGDSGSQSSSDADGSQGSSQGQGDKAKATKPSNRDAEVEERGSKSRGKSEDKHESDDD